MNRNLGFTPKGLHLKAQGKRSATLREFAATRVLPTLKGYITVAATVIQPFQGRPTAWRRPICMAPAHPQGGASLTLGFEMQPLRGKDGVRLCESVMR
jgi:hypothetical protein